MKRKTRSSSSTTTAAERKSKKTKTKNGSELTEFSTSTKLDLSSPEKLFASLISPTPPKDFFSHNWEKKPLLIQREDPEFYGALFSKAYLEELLKNEEINYVEDINVCRYVEGEKEFLNGEEGTKATAAKVLKEVKENKATIQFHQPQRFKDLLWQLSGNLERLFGCLVGANVYITPPDAQGLAPHYDDVEVFILQLEGEKNWKLYSPTTELPQDYSADLDQDAIGKPTHEFTLKAGDLVYFPRGTIHQAETLKCKSHSTHITFSTYQQNAWGDFISAALTQAVERAMESDVKFRKGLPVNYLSSIGLSMESIEGTDEKAIAVKKDTESFKKQLKELLISLVDHVDASETADKLAGDFMASRLPPFVGEKEDDEKEDNSAKPTEDSEVKFRYPEYVRITSGSAAPTAPIIALADGDTDDDEDDGEMSDDEDENSEDESMEESEEEPKTKKGGKSKQAAENGKKGKDKKATKGKKDEDEEEATSKKGKKNGGKAASKKAGKKDKKKEASEEEDEEMSEDDGGKKAEKKKDKKGKKDAEEDEEDSDAEYELGTEDSSEDSGGSDDESEDEAEAWVLVHHSLGNDRAHHMMAMQEPSILKFALSYQEALVYLYHKRHEFVSVKSLPLDVSEALYLINSLWAEGLIDIK